MEILKEIKEEVSEIKIQSNRLVINTANLCKVCGKEEANGEIVNVVEDKRVAVCYSWRECYKEIDWTTI